VANQLGPIDIECDAPPYPIVRACHKIGIQTPEDVRWNRISHFLGTQDRMREWLYAQPWLSLLGFGQSPANTCLCGQRLPQLERYTFLLNSGHQKDYFLGQCVCCRTVFWEEG
jgi:hypothetical protein